jgi:NaMN:DMB phosphoribosyltransferase
MSLRIAVQMDPLESVNPAGDTIANRDAFTTEAAAEMKVSRATFGRILKRGRAKVADALINGKALKIEGDISIATTKYIVEDKTANFKEIVESAGRPYYYSDPGLENSKIPGVQIYAKGYVKEGVGMGGASLLAGLYGVTQKQLVEETDRVLMTVELPKK